jgi:uncharacterized membrane protein
MSINVKLTLYCHPQEFYLIFTLWFAICVGEVIFKKMEKIQERALRFIYEDFNSDYDSFLLMSGLPSLKIRRLRMMGRFKI